jgi:hypothetical protein
MTICGTGPAACSHKSPAIRGWLQQHPRFHKHHTPTYSSWINQIERWLAYLQTLEKDIRDWVAGWNANPKPFIWTKTAEQILQSLSRFPQRATTSNTN